LSNSLNAVDGRVKNGNGGKMEEIFNKDSFKDAIAKKIKIKKH
jgi:hypothetical protein